MITVIKTGTLLGTFLLAATGAIAAFRAVTRQPVFGLDLLLEVLSSSVFQAVICVGVLIGVRRIMFRLNDRDV